MKVVKFWQVVEKVSLKLIIDEDDGTTDTADAALDPKPQGSGSSSGGAEGSLGA